MLEHLHERVEVYFNLHKRVWSVRSCETGRVIGHFEFVALKNVQWVVRPAGREKVRREGRKNVHAFARGLLWVQGARQLSPSRLEGWEALTYNPYKHETFVDKASGDPVQASDWAWMTLEEGKPSVWRYHED